MKNYLELHCASAFSFLESTLLPELLVDRAAALGYPALALLDRDGVYGAPRFHKAATRAGIKPIIGAELTVCSGQCAVGSAQGKSKDVATARPFSREMLPTAHRPLSSVSPFSSNPGKATKISAASSRA
ncbi:MAG: PHP domain-containing protein [Acidobacteria bacterium]|nr:PHP domain-containing protein [Acidobacteriota bacterium]